VERSSDQAYEAKILGWKAGELVEDITEQ